MSDNSSCTNVIRQRTRSVRGFTSLLFSVSGLRGPRTDVLKGQVTSTERAKPQYQGATAAKPAG